MRCTATGLVILALAFPNSSLGGDGVIEINHTCASGAGCFPNDGSGYPVEINGLDGLSYRLTSDLRLFGPAFSVNSVAIAISGSGVTLDLGGFSILGDCLNCTTSGTGHGIDASFAEGVEVRNGRVLGMGGHGIALGFRSIVDGLRAESNRSSGIVVKEGSRVRDCLASRNAQIGIDAGEKSAVENCTVWLNGGNGIAAASQCSISENIVGLNTGAGIVVSHGASVQRNTLSNNSSGGIEAASGALILQNVSYADGGTIGSGITASTGSLLRENSVRNGGGFGLTLGGQAGYADNVIFDNQGGSVSGGANLGGNYCNPVCPP